MIRTRFDLDRWQEIFQTITRNKTRSVLTAFGIFWGIFMLVTLMGGGQGLRSILGAGFEGFASNSCVIFANETSEPYKGFRKGRQWNLNNTDVDRVKNSVVGVDVVTPSVNVWGGTVVYNDHSMSSSIKGFYPDIQKVESVTLIYGRYINEMDIHENRKVCVIGEKVYETLFPKGGNPCGAFVKAQGVYYQVVGVTGSGQQAININGTSEESVVLPFTTLQQTYNMGDRVQMLYVTAKDGYTIDEIQQSVEQVIKRAHLIHPDDKQAIMLLNTAALFGIVDSLFSGLDILIWMIGLGTLLAGAIGVSNIMMVTVRERTTEFGIRRAIGARPRDILIQILSESMVLTLIAGMGGISFSVLILNATNIMVNASGEYQGNFLISFWTAIGAALLLLVLGLLSGLAPAFRAMAIKPVDAIRDE